MTDRDPDLDRLILEQRHLAEVEKGERATLIQQAADACEWMKSVVGAYPDAAKKVTIHQYYETAKVSFLGSDGQVVFSGGQVIHWYFPDFSCPGGISGQSKDDGGYQADFKRALGIWIARQLPYHLAADEAQQIEEERKRSDAAAKKRIDTKLNLSLAAFAILVVVLAWYLGSRP